MKNIYCTLDTETFGGASSPKGIYHLAGIVHDRQGGIYATFNFLIAEHYEEIQKDDYAKKNFHLYEEMVLNGDVTMIPTEEMAIDIVDAICTYYNVGYMVAFNSGFDYVKTACRSLLEGREFIDLWLVALQTIACRKKYVNYCKDHNFRTARGSCSTSAQVVYGYLTNNPDYIEEHTALEDAKIEMEIFLACIKTHLAYTKNCHCWDYERVRELFPPCI